MNDPVSVNPNRMFNVADLVLDMIESKGGVLGLLELASTSLETEDSSTSPTQSELEEAVSLLIRLGFIERVERTGGA